MKSKLNFNKKVCNVFLVLFLLTASFKAVAQEIKSSSLKDFNVIIEKTENGIKMKNVKGGSWVDLSFNLNNYQPQAVDEYGMVELDKVSSIKDKNLTDFLITIIKTDTGIELKGIEGTAWTELKFSLAENEKQSINQYGMTSLN
ncbi:hypothetical protein [Formosa sp. S-31]|uniref:hypothetical protein n=1 Tax=Formosa sp. S-31 TaxID=2790949 RepID=UPI003EBB9127